MQDLKKFSKLFLFAIISAFIILSSNAYALEIQLSKSAYGSGETLIARLEANFSSALSSKDVFFYRGHVLTNMVYDAVLAGNVFYIYAITPDTARNYTLAVKNVKYMENGLAKEADISKNFTVLAEKAEFSVNPGFILAMEGSEFSIRLANKKENFTEVNAGFQGAQQAISLPPLDSRTIIFAAADIDKFTELSLSLQGEKTSYSIPVLAYPLSEETQNQANETQQGNASGNYTSNTSQANVTLNSTNQTQVSTNATANASIIEENASEIPQQETLRFSQESIIGLSLTKEQLPFSFTLSLMNLNTEAISDISFSYSPELEGIISLAPDFIDSIEPASSYDIELTINGAEEGFFNGTIVAESISQGLSAVFYFEANITKDFSSIPDNIPEAECNEEGETTCQSGEYCDGEERSYLASGGICCLGGICKKIEPEKPKSSGSTGKIIGAVILLLVMLLAVFLFMKFKKAPKKEMKEIFKKAESEYEKGRSLKSV